MSDFSATFAPNKCVLANSSGTNIFIGCCENGKKLRHRAEKDRRRRAHNTPGAGNALGTCACRGKLASAADCRSCR
jgi:hypothetical protein